MAFRLPYLCQLWTVAFRKLKPLNYFYVAASTNMQKSVIDQEKQKYYDKLQHSHWPPYNFNQIDYKIFIFLF